MLRALIAALALTTSSISFAADSDASRGAVLPEGKAAVVGGHHVLTTAAAILVPLIAVGAVIAVTKNNDKGVTTATN